MSATQPSIVIIGGGTGGLSVASLLRRRRPGASITLIDPAEFHYYQPAWTLVGGGAYSMNATRRPLNALLPANVKHIREKVVSLQADENRIQLENNTSVDYDFLVVAAGIQLNWGAIKGLEETLGKNGVTSNYHHQFASYTWELLKHFKGGKAVFTQPAGPIKCPGAPQKALYLSADYFSKQGISADLSFYSGGASIFGVGFYATPLKKVIDGWNAEQHYKTQLVEVRGDDKVAVFASGEGDNIQHHEVTFDILHAVPPQQAPDFIRESNLSNEGGWLAVDKHSLRSTHKDNVFGLGDCTSSPNSKTCAAIKAQTPVLVDNLLQAIDGKSTEAAYDGYAACPVTTENGRVLLAEFTYGGTVETTLPLDARKPRRFYWWLKRSFLPWFYWNLLLKGRNLPAVHKKRDKLVAKAEQEAQQAA